MAMLDSTDPAHAAHPYMAHPHAAYPHMHGRDEVPWRPEVWHRLDAALQEELTRTRVAARFLPSFHVSAKTLTVPSDAVSSTSGSPLLAVDEAQTTPICEYSVEFTLTPTQVEHEAAVADTMVMGRGHYASTGITLVSRAANILAQAEDMVIFQGSNALKDPLFSGPTQQVICGKGPMDTGLLQITLGTTGPSGVAAGAPANAVTVRPAGSGQPPPYQYNTIAGVEQAYVGLQGQKRYGPYALVLHTIPFADAYSPLDSKYTTPADPILKLVTAGFHGSGTVLSSDSPVVTGIGIGPGPGPGPGLALPFPSDQRGSNILYTGVLVSTDANIVDLVRGRLHPENDAVITFVQKDAQGDYLFRVVQRFALRLKHPSAAILLEFAGVIEAH